MKPTCFKAYDIRGRVGHDLDEAVAERIGFAFAQVMNARRVVVGRDGRESSPAFQAAVIRGICAFGSDVDDIAVAGTEEVYFATDHLGASGGIEVTASHNPIDYNGMKLVGPESRPLTQTEFDTIAERSLTDISPVEVPGRRHDLNTRDAYAAHVSDFVDARRIGPVRMVVNAGNGVAGRAFDTILDVLRQRGARIDVERIHHEPDCRFPNGIPNPLLPENRPATSDAVLRHNADLGVAWDGDFDRCFFFDADGSFIDGEYVVSLLAAAALARHPGGSIIHDPRVIWSTLAAVRHGGGKAIAARTGHAFIKAAMRENNAIYGGEMSAHHYFRDFMFCDSGMIPWVLILEHMSRSKKSLAELVAGMKRSFPSSGEINFTVPDPTAVMDFVQTRYAEQAEEIDMLDGLSMSFGDWRMNLRASSTEPLLRLNVETRADPGLLIRKRKEMEDICRSFTAAE